MNVSATLKKDVLLCLSMADYADGKALHACGRWENAKICKITWFSLVYADFDVNQ